MKPLKLKELRLRHYRAFSDARLVLDDLTFLVGRNGAGKSTLMDALSFVGEAVTDSLGTALERRGNLEGIRQRQSGKGARYDVSVAVRLELDEGPQVLYGFKLGNEPKKASYIIKQEVLVASPPTMFEGTRIPQFLRDRDGFHSEDVEGIEPLPDRESLLFPLIAGLYPIWKQMNAFFQKISIHQFSPQAIRGEPKIGGKERLSRDGGNAGDMLKNTKPADRAWIEARLEAAVPGILGVKAKARDGRRVIVFEQEGDGGKPYPFDASMMSDGTARALAVLLALRQTPRPSIVCLDEIEDSLHPHAQEVLLEAITSASEEFPVVVSTHNPEILSHESATGNRTRIVQWNQGASAIYSLSDQVLDKLRPPQTVGRLLRSNALWTREEPSTVGPEADFFKVT